MTTCTCGTIHGNIQSANRVDPTRTQTLRKRFEADMVRRFSIIKKEIMDAVATKDIFGLARRPVVFAELQPGQFQFVKSDQKVDAFMKWLNEMEEKHILTTETRPGMYGGEKPWTNIYIQSAYQRGLSRATAELKKAGYDVPTTGTLDLTGKTPLAVAMNQPFHAERVALIYTRAYNELKGITAAMDQQISRVLAQGMAEGRNPMEIAKLLVDRVDKIGITRARTLARTEVISAHHQATINEYERWKISGVTVEAEWVIAGWNVCPVCRSMSGKVFSLDKIRYMIPAHPNCRCAAIPIIKEPKTKLGKIAKTAFSPLGRVPRTPLAPQGKVYSGDELDKMFQNGYEFTETEDAVKKKAVCDNLWKALKNDADFKKFVNAARAREDLNLLKPSSYAESGRELVRRLIREWAYSSADNSPVSVLMQKFANEEFGLDAATIHIWKSFNKYGEKFDFWEAQEPALKKFLRAQYEATQAELKAKGISHITVYRGAGMDKLPLGPMGVVNDMEVTLQPISSFSSDLQVAEMFANSGAASGGPRIIMKVTVPISRVFSTTLTGYGCSSESEFVILGKSPQRVLGVYSTKNIFPKSF